MTSTSSDQAHRERNGTFKKGHKKQGGRKRGAPNAMTRELEQLILGAAEKIGSDGQGKDGLAGYFVYLGLEHPELYLKFLGRLLRVESLVQQVRILRGG